MKAKVYLTAISLAIVVLSAEASYSRYRWSRYTDERSVSLECGNSSILAGFKFGYKNCRDRKTGTLSIANTYSEKRTLAIGGNVVIKNRQYFHENDSNKYALIEFNALKTLSVNVKNIDYSDSYYLRVNSGASGINSKNNLSVKCNSPTRKTAGLIITPSCSSTQPRFIIENASKQTKWIGYKGSGNNSKFKNIIKLDEREQTLVDLSIIYSGARPNSRSYNLTIDTEEE